VGTDEYSADVRAIQALIARQFGSLSWAPDKPADWEAFAADFHPDAALDRQSARRSKPLSNG
jgi:hypothetical protein